MIEQLNIKLFLAINQYAGSSKIIDVIAVSLAEYLPYVFIIILLYLWFKQNAEKKVALLHACYSAILGLFINLAISSVYFHPRPFMENLGTTLIHHVADSSMPSDHTTFMLSIAISLFLNKPTGMLGYILLVSGFIGGVSRVFIGVHFPMDIFASVIVSLLAAVTVSLLNARLESLDKFAMSIYETCLSALNNQFRC